MYIESQYQSFSTTKILENHSRTWTAKRGLRAGAWKALAELARTAAARAKLANFILDVLVDIK